MNEDFSRELAKRVKEVKQEARDYRLRMFLLGVGIAGVVALLAMIFYFAITATG